MMASSIRSKLERDFCLMIVLLLSASSSSLSEEGRGVSSVKSKMGVKVYCVDEVDAKSDVGEEEGVIAGLLSNM